MAKSPDPMTDDVARPQWSRGSLFNYTHETHLRMG